MNRMLYLEAALLWGGEAQIQMAIEEMAELTVDLCHVIRGRKHISECAEEVADCQIMMEQLQAVIDGRAVAQYKAAKLKRLAERIYAAKNAGGSKGGEQES